MPATPFNFAEAQRAVIRVYYDELRGLKDWSAPRYAAFMRAAAPLARYARLPFSQYERRLAARVAQDAIAASELQSAGSLGRVPETLDPERGAPVGG